MSSESAENLFGFVFLSQVYRACKDWINTPPDPSKPRDRELEYDIGMLEYICNPLRWAQHCPTEKEMDAITTFLGSLIAPKFSVRAPDLWQKIDQFATTYTLYSDPKFKRFSGEFIVENKTQGENVDGDDEESEEEEEFEVVIKRRTDFHPICVAGDESSDTEEEEDVIEIPQPKKANSEQAPVQKKPSSPPIKQEPSEPPAIKRTHHRKIVVWKPKTYFLRHRHSDEEKH